jgi:hypothetical protein
MTSSGIPRLTIGAKSVAFTPCGHRSDKNRIYAAKELKQNLKYCKQLRKLYLQTEKSKEKNAPSNYPKTPLRCQLDFELLLKPYTSLGYKVMPTVLHTTFAKS